MRKRSKQSYKIMLTSDWTLTFPLVPQILLLRLSPPVSALDAATDGVLKLFSSPLLSLRKKEHS